MSVTGGEHQTRAKNSWDNLPRHHVLSAAYHLPGALGLLNVAIVTVRQRVREIGIRRAVGAPPRVFFAVFMESVVATSGRRRHRRGSRRRRTLLAARNNRNRAQRDTGVLPLATAGVATSTSIGALVRIIPALAGRAYRRLTRSATEGSVTRPWLAGPRVFAVGSRPCQNQRAASRACVFVVDDHAFLEEGLRRGRVVRSPPSRRAASRTFATFREASVPSKRAERRAS